jgi:hypothetical protein
VLALIVALACTACAPFNTAGCSDRNEKEMTQLATFVRVGMDIVSSSYADVPPPASVPPETIREIIVRRGTPFKELELLDRYRVQFFSQDGQWAAVAWDPQNGQKLLQDLRCTRLLDEPTWKSCTSGHDFNLNWNACRP